MGGLCFARGWMLRLRLVPQGWVWAMGVVEAAWFTQDA
jgi:hypothetical protein